MGISEQYLASIQHPWNTAVNQMAGNGSAQACGYCSLIPILSLKLINSTQGI